MKNNKQSTAPLLAVALILNLQFASGQTMILT